MVINALTARQMYRERLRKAAEKKALEKKCSLPEYWVLHRGTMDLRTGRWVSDDHQVRYYRTYEEAHMAKHSIGYPWPGYVVYIVRRYRHGQKTEGNNTQ